jgi:tetratricopeptide (TPR) repeat protein
MRGMAFSFFALLLAAHLAAQPGSDVLASATGLIRAGRYSEAHELLNAASKQGPLDPRLMTLDGFALARMGRDRDALASYDEALRAAPEYLPALEGAAELRFESRSRNAAEMLHKIVALRPDEQTAHAMLATLAFEQRDCKTALAEFAKSEQLISTQPAALEQRGACLVQLHRPDEASGVFQQLTKVDPKNARAHYNVAFSELQAGRPSGAIQAITALPASARDADTLDLLTDAYEKTGDTPTAVATLRSAIVQYPENTRLYVHFANLCMAHNSFQAGIDMLNAGISRSPEAASLYLARGILQAQLAHYSAAEDDFSRAEALDPNTRYAAALENMAKLQQDQLGPAVDDLRKRIKRQPQDAFLYYLLAETLARRGATPGSPEFAEALDAAKTAVKLQPQLGLARDVLGRLYLQQGNIEGAIAESRLAFDKDPSDLTALYHLIQALRKAGKTNEIPALTRKLADLRQNAQKKESSERKFAIVTSGGSAR